MKEAQRNMYREGFADGLSRAMSIVSRYVLPDRDGYKDYLKMMQIEKFNDGADIAFRGAANDIYAKLERLRKDGTED